MALEWVPEAYPRSGGLAAAGFYKLLGRPRLDPLTVLVRETAQNSWDARQPEAESVKFSIAGYELTDGERTALRDRVFVDARAAGVSGLVEALNDPGLMGLFISDRDTLGLGGPFQADEADPSAVYDWVDFVLNVGKANTQGHTGGTYGFGKTISYIVSSINTVVVHSRTMYRGRPQTRLIACAIGDEFTRRGKLWTGRHWWGRSNDGTPEPITGRAADQLATAIGMPEFEAGELGTNLLVLAPDFGGRKPQQAMNFIAESITWHLWPKFASRGHGQPMDFWVSWNGDYVDIPDPVDRPPLHGFAQAFQALLDGAAEGHHKDGTRVDVIRCERPRTQVGDLVTVPLVQRERATVDDGYDPLDPDSPRPAAAIQGICHHVALLRTPELVVDYLEGPAPPEGGTEWAGVFRARPEHDGRFAAAEPPTHDSWRPELLPKGSDRVIVNVGLKRIRSSLDERWAPRSSHVDAHPLSTALVANDLAHLVGTTEAKGPGREPGDGGGSSGGTPRPQVDMRGTGPIEFRGEPATLASFRVTPARDTEGTVLHVVVGAALDGTTIDTDLDPNLQLAVARINGAEEPLEGTEATLECSGREPVEVELVITRGPATTVLINLQTQPVGAE